MAKAKAKVKRPLTQKEIRARRKPRDSETITIINTSPQLIRIHCRPAPNQDFYYGARDVDLFPGKRVTLPKSRLWTTQISRLRKRGMISIISDSEKVKQKKQEYLQKAAEREEANQKKELANKVKTSKKKKKKLVAKTDENKKSDDLKNSDKSIISGQPTE